MGNFKNENWSQIENWCIDEQDIQIMVIGPLRGLLGKNGYDYHKITRLDKIKWIG